MPTIVKTPGGTRILSGQQYGAPDKLVRFERRTLFEARTARQTGERAIVRPDPTDADLAQPFIFDFRPGGTIFRVVAQGSSFYDAPPVPCNLVDVNDTAFGGTIQVYAIFIHGTSVFRSGGPPTVESCFPQVKGGYILPAFYDRDKRQWYFSFPFVGIRTPTTTTEVGRLRTNPSNADQWRVVQ